MRSVNKVGKECSAAHLLNSIHRKGKTSRRVVGRFGGKHEANKQPRVQDETLIGTLGLLAIGYVLVKNLPDIVRYIRISRM